MRVSRCTASGKAHQYGRTTSSGSVVQNDPVNQTDPTGTEAFDEKKYKGENLKLVKVMNSAMSAKGDIKLTTKINGSSVTISRHENSVSVTTTTKGYSVSFTGNYSSLKGKEGFAITNAKVTGDVKVSGDPGRITVFSGVGRESRQAGPAYVTSGSATITPYKSGGGLTGFFTNKLAGAVASQTIQAGQGHMMVDDDEK